MVMLFCSVHSSSDEKSIRPIGTRTLISQVNFRQCRINTYGGKILFRRFGTHTLKAQQAFRRCRTHI